MIEPDEIAAEVRARLERELVAAQFHPPESAFLDRIERLSATLALWGSRINLTARPNDSGEITFHVLDSLVPLMLADKGADERLGGAFAPGRRVLDAGSGAGFPGLVLAAASATRFTLTEARRKRASFLSVASAEMGLDNVTVAERRIAPGDFSAAFDAALTRAFGAFADFYEIAAHALKAGGVAIIYASTSQRLNLEAAREAGLVDYRRLPYELKRDGTSIRRVLALWTKPY